MLTGRPPFQAATPIETMLLALEHDPVLPRALTRGWIPISKWSPSSVCKSRLRSVISRRRRWPMTWRRFCAAILSRPGRRRLRALAARLMGETHHAPVLENWGLLWIFHSIALLIFFGLPTGSRSRVSGRAGLMC